MAKLKGNLVVAQSGGPTAVINASLAGVAQEACKHCDAITGRLRLAARHRRHPVRAPDRPGQRADPEPGPAARDAGFGAGLVPPQGHAGRLRSHPGGVQGAQYPLLLLHRRQRLDGHGAPRQPAGAEAPATSWLAWACPRPSTTTWTSPTTAPATAASRAGSLRRSATPAWTPRPSGWWTRSRSIEIMGRNAGWITAASALARDHEDAAPHLIYVPERADQHGPAS